MKSRKNRLSAIPIGWLAVLLSPGAIAAPESGNWRFEVLLDDKPIGYHRFSLTRLGEEQVLETEAKFDVKFLFVTAFRYRHENIETWQDGCLTSVEAYTNSNGKKHEVSGDRSDGRFSVSGANGSEILGDCVQSFAYWNPSILYADRLLNTQTGEYEEVTVTALGREPYTIGEDTVVAERYTISAQGGDITLWYTSGDRRWLGLEAPARGDRRIRYTPIEVPAPQGLRIAATGQD